MTLKIQRLARALEADPHDGDALLEMYHETRRRLKQIRQRDDIYREWEDEHDGIVSISINLKSCYGDDSDALMRASEYLPREGWSILRDGGEIVHMDGITSISLSLIHERETIYMPQRPIGKSIKGKM